MEIVIINGPNLNLLGKREPVLYGSEDFETVLQDLRRAFPSVSLSYRYCADEGIMVSELHGAAARGVQGIVLNPAALTHTSLAVADAVAAIDVPVVEVHISNVYAREAYRHKSWVSRYAVGSLSGFGVHGYALALRFLCDRA